MVVSVGTGRAVIVNGAALLLPPGAVTVTFLVVRLAPAETAKFAVTVVSFTTVSPLTVTLPPDTFTAVAPVRPLPVSVTPKGGVLRGPEGRPVAVLTIEVSAGPSTLYVAGPLVPPGVVTVMLLGPSAALLAVLKVALIVVAFTTVTPLTVRPLAGARTPTVVPDAVKLLPDSVTATGTLRSP
jgi:hypothetical protein